MDTLLHLWTQFNAYAKTNPIMAGALSLYGLGVLTFLVKGIPTRIWAFVKRQSTTSLTFTSQSTGTGMETFLNFMAWFEETTWAKWSRSMSILGGDKNGRRGPVPAGDTAADDDVGTVVGVGEGSHFFFYAGRPFWMVFSRIEAGGSQHQITYQITLTALGRSRARLVQLIEEFRYKPDRCRLSVYTYRYDDWMRTSDVPKRPLDTVVIDRAIKAELLGHIEQWQQSRQWFEHRGLPYKLTCILKGMPGTGKTSLIKALASHFQMNVCMMNLSTMTDATFERALSDAPNRSIIVIEDFDSSHATRARSALKATPTQAVAADQANKDDDSLAGLLNGGLTLSGILNALDGILSLDGKIIFMTTNVYETIDPALLRKGRVDHTYELAALGDPEVRDYIAVMFPDAEIPQGLHFDSILGCDLQAIYFDHREDAQAFVRAIPKAHARLQATA